MQKTLILITDLNKALKLFNKELVIANLVTELLLKKFLDIVELEKKNPKFGKRRLVKRISVKICRHIFHLIFSSQDLKRAVFGLLEELADLNRSQRNTIMMIVKRMLEK